MRTSGDGNPNPDADLPAGGASPAGRARRRLGTPSTAGEVSVAIRLGRVVLIMGAIAAGGLLVAVGTGAVSLPSAQNGPQSTMSSAQTSPAASRIAADRLWASAACTDILDWKNEIQRDATSLDLSFGALTRIKDAIGSSTRALDEVQQLGLPPDADNAHTRAEIDQLSGDVAARVQDAEGAARSLANGDLASIGTVVSDLENDTAAGTQIVAELRHVVSVDLGLSLVETGACRQLAGIPV